jgi:hypothetical protein
VNSFVAKNRKSSLGPARKLRDVPKDLAASFSAVLRFIRWHRHIARPALARPRREGREVDLLKAVCRKDHLNGPAPQ